MVKEGDIVEEAPPCCEPTTKTENQKDQDLAVTEIVSSSSSEGGQENDNNNNNNNTSIDLEEGRTNDSSLDDNNNSNTTDQEREATVDTAVQITTEGQSSELSSLAEHPTGYLVLRPGNVAQAPPPNSNNRRMVPNGCAVCLGDYDVGDTVVWSCNPHCQHAFHFECILEWLLKIPDGGTPCPCCRQEFTDWDTDRQERKIKWAAGV